MEDVAIYFSCENRPDFQILIHTYIENDHLLIFYYNNMSSANYKLKVIVQYGNEGDT